MERSRLRAILRNTRAVLLRRGVPVDDVEDLVQEAFVRVARYEKTEVVRSREAVMIRTAVNLSIDQGRRVSRAPFASAILPIEEIADSQPQPDDIAIARARLHRASEGLAQLQDKTRRILLARRIDDLSVAEIAEMERMSCPPSAPMAQI